LAAPGVSDLTQEKNLRGAGILGLASGGLLLAVGLPIWLLTYSIAKTDDGRAL
jgi:hypothetical protein